MNKEFIWNGEAFVCNYCGSPVEKTWGEQDTHNASTQQYPHVVICRVCNAVRGEWFTPQERDEALWQTRERV